MALIEPEHILLGLLLETGTMGGRCLALAGVWFVDIRPRLAQFYEGGE